MQKVYLNSIYIATEGEGIFIGTPQIFVRYQGCNIGCFNCDSKDTWKFDEKTLVSLNHVVEEVEKLSIKNNGLKRVSITGGDPLDSKNIDSLKSLIRVLKRKNYFINIEASGQKIDHEVFDTVDFISFDYKASSTKKVNKNDALNALLEKYPRDKFQIKSAIENENDLNEYYKVYKTYEDKYKSLTLANNWVVTPAVNFNERYPFQKIQNIIALNQNLGSVFRVICQQHKVIYGTDSRNV